MARRGTSVGMEQDVDAMEDSQHLGVIGHATNAGIMVDANNKDNNNNNNNNNDDDDDDSVDFSIFYQVQEIEHTLRELKTLLLHTDDRGGISAERDGGAPVSSSYSSSSWARTTDPTNNTASDETKLISPTTTNTSLKEEDKTIEERGSPAAAAEAAPAPCHSYPCSTMTTLDEDRACSSSTNRIVMISKTARTGSNDDDDDDDDYSSSSSSCISQVGDEKSRESEELLNEQQQMLDQVVFVGGTTTCGEKKNQHHHHNARRLPTPLVVKLNPSMDEKDFLRAEQRDDSESDGRHYCPTTPCPPRRDNPFLVNYDADEDKTIGKKKHSNHAADSQADNKDHHSVVDSKDQIDPMAEEHALCVPMGKEPLLGLYHEQQHPTTATQRTAHSKTITSILSRKGGSGGGGAMQYYHRSNNRTPRRSSNNIAPPAMDPVYAFEYAKISTNGSDESSAWFGFKESRTKVSPLAVTNKELTTPAYACRNSNDDDDDDDDDETVEEDDRLSFDQQVVRSIIENAVSTDWDEDEGTLIGGSAGRLYEETALEFILADLQKLIETASHPFQQCAALTALDDVSDCDCDNDDAIIVSMDETNEFGTTKLLDLEDLFAKVADMMVPDCLATPRSNAPIIGLPGDEERPVLSMEQQPENSITQNQITILPVQYETDVEGPVCVDTPTPRLILQSVLGFAGFNSESREGADETNRDGGICCGGRRRQNDLAISSSIEDNSVCSQPEDGNARKKKAVAGSCHASREDKKGNRSDDDDGGVPSALLESCPRSKDVIDEVLKGKRTTPSQVDPLKRDRPEIISDPNSLVAENVANIESGFSHRPEDKTGDNHQENDDRAVEILLIDTESSDEQSVVEQEESPTLAVLEEKELNYPIEKRQETPEKWSNNEGKKLAAQIGSEENLDLGLEVVEKFIFESSENIMHHIQLPDEEVVDQFHNSSVVVRRKECSWENDDFSIDYPEDGDLSNDSMCIPSPPTVVAVNLEEASGEVKVANSKTGEQEYPDFTLPSRRLNTAGLSSEDFFAFDYSSSSSKDPLPDPLSIVTRTLLPSPSALSVSKTANNTPTNTFSRSQTGKDTPKAGCIITSAPIFASDIPSPSCYVRNVPLSPFADRSPRNHRQENAGKEDIRRSERGFFPSALVKSSPADVQQRATTFENTGNSNARESVVYCFDDQENCAPSPSRPTQRGTLLPAQDKPISSYEDASEETACIGIANNVEEEDIIPTIQTHPTSRITITRRGTTESKAAAVETNNSSHSFISIWRDISDERSDVDDDGKETMKGVKSILRKEGVMSRINRVRWDESELSKTKGSARSSIHRRSIYKGKCPLDAMIDQISKIQEERPDYEDIFMVDIPGQSTSWFLSHQVERTTQQGYMC